MTIGRGPRFAEVIYSGVPVLARSFVARGLRLCLIQCRVIENTKAETLSRFMREVISDKVSLVSTDDHSGYHYLDRHFPHGFVHHSAGEYVHGAIHTNTIEGFWSLVKRDNRPK